ncbi:MAG: hypothetical protein DMG00_30400, partial [Acidobacteria bacterium]
MHRLWLVIVSVSLLLGTLCASAYAQEASVIGTVVDDTRSVLPGVTVTATDLGSGVQTVAVTDARGEYRLRLQPGTYKIQAE